MSDKWVKVSRGIYRKPNGRYLVRFRPKDSPSFCAEFDTIKEAEAVYNEKKKEVTHTEHPHLRPQTDLTFREYAQIYIEKYAKEKNLETYNRVSQYAITRFIEYFGDRKLSSITPYDVSSYIVDRRKKIIQTDDGEKTVTIQPATINRELAILKHMFNQAVEWQVFSHNPLTKVKKLKGVKPRLRFLSEDEYAELLKVAHGRIKDIIQLGLATGLRMGNIKRLNIQRDADYENKRIYLSRVKGQTDGKYIPMNETAKEILAQQTEPEPFNYDFSSAFTNCVIKAGLPHAGENKVTFHTLRHTFASWLVKGGVPLFDVKELMLHSRIETTQLYAHLAPHHLAEKSSMLDSILSPQRHQTKNIEMAAIKKYMASEDEHSS